MSKKIVSYDLTRPVYPSPGGLITSVDAEGKPNIITLGETFNLSIRKPVIVGIAIAPARYSHQLIRECGEFVVNLPTSKIIDKVIQCGSASGRDGVNKFEEFGLTPLPADKVKPPLIAECPVNIECQLLEVIQIGDHDLFKGLAVAEHVDEDMFDDEGKLVPGRLDFFSMVRGQFFAQGERLKPSVERRLARK